jgi:excinuclease UvrABC ATPase subunit
VICSLKRKKRALGDGSHRDFHSTSKADDAKRAREMERLLLKCTSCQQCMFCAMSANGKRFMKETLEVKWKGKNIYDILKMTVEEALTFFQDIPAVHDRVKTLR